MGTPWRIFKTVRHVTDGFFQSVWKFCPRTGSARVRDSRCLFELDEIGAADFRVVMDALKMGFIPEPG